MTPLQKAAQYAFDILVSCDPLPCEIEAAKELRKALDAELQQPVEPYAVFHGLVDSGEHGAFNLDLLKMIPRGAYLYLHPPHPQATTPVPKGYVLVPIEPTIEMLKAGRDTPCSAGPNDIEDDYRSVYKAMLEAAQGEKP